MVQGFTTKKQLVCDEKSVTKSVFRLKIKIAMNFTSQATKEKGI